MLNKISKILFPALGVCCLAGTLTGCSLLPMEEPELKPPLVQPVTESLTLFEAKKANITKQITGVATFASDKMDYLFYKESSGRLTSFNVKLGDKVHAGDVVASTETGDLEMKIRLQEIAIEKIKISMAQVIADKGGDDPDVRLKMLDYESAQLQLKSLRSQLERSTLVATVDGIITYIEPMKLGDQVSAYKQLVTISDPNSMKLVYTASSQNDLVGVEINMDVNVKIKDKSYVGKVVQTPMTAPISDNKTIQDKNSKSLFINVPKLPAEVSVGSQADITIVTEQRENVLVIPRSGLRSYMGRDYVQIMEGESRKEIDVEKGIVAAREVEIRKGITEGQKIILNN